MAFTARNWKVGHELHERCPGAAAPAWRSSKRLPGRVTFALNRIELSAGVDEGFPGRRIKVSGEFLSRRIVKSVRTLLLILMAAVVCVADCLRNVASSWFHALHRGRKRLRCAPRSATRVRLLRQMLTESLLLALIGGSLGLAFASWSRPYCSRSCLKASRCRVTFPLAAE